MSRSRLDKIDKKILKRLQEDGRVTNVELAKFVGISAPPCLRRVRVLQESGFIKGYFAKVDATKLGYGVNVYAMVKLKSHAEKELTVFEEYVTKFPMVRECHMLAGDVDFMLKVVAKSWDDYQEFHQEFLGSAPNVVSVKSSLSIRSSKSLPGIPIE